MPPKANKSNKNATRDKPKHSGKSTTVTKKEGSGGKGSWGNSKDDAKFDQDDDREDFDPAEKASSPHKEAPPASAGSPHKEAPPASAGSPHKKAPPASAAPAPASPSEDAPKVVASSSSKGAKPSASKKGQSSAAPPSNEEESKPSSSNKGDAKSSNKGESKSSNKEDSEPAEKEEPKAKEEPKKKAAKKGDKGKKEEAKSSEKEDSKPSDKEESKSSNKEEFKVKKEESNASNKEEPEASQKEESKASKKEESKASKKEESKASKKEESKSAKKEESKASKKEESKASKKEESKASPKEDSKSSPKEDSKSSLKEESKASPKEESKASKKSESKASTSTKNESKSASKTEGGLRSPPTSSPQKASKSGSGAMGPTEEKKSKFASSISDFNKFKKEIKVLTNEYLVSFSTSDFSKGVKDLGQTLFHQDIPAIVVKMALDRKPEEREKLSALLQELHKKGILTDLQLLQGFKKLYHSLNDIILDVPNGKTLISEFLNRAVSQKILDPKEAKEMEKGADLLVNSEGLLKIKKDIDRLVQEYFSNRELEDITKSAGEMERHYHFELVKRLVSISLDRSDQERELVSKFLASASGGVVATDQVVKGFTILLARVEDLIKDVPEVLRLLSCFIARAVVDEALPPAFLLRVDLAVGDMGYHVVEQAQELLRRDAPGEALGRCWLGDSKVPSIMAQIANLNIEDQLEVFRQVQALVNV